MRLYTNKEFRKKLRYTPAVFDAATFCLGCATKPSHIKKGDRYYLIFPRKNISCFFAYGSLLHKFGFRSNMLAGDGSHADMVGNKIMIRTTERGVAFAKAAHKNRKWVMKEQRKRLGF